MKKSTPNRWPETLVLAAVFFLPFSKTAAEAGFIAALVLWLAGKAARREPFTCPRPVKAAYLAFLFMTLLSITQAEPNQQQTSLRGFLKWLKFIGVFFMSAELFENPSAAKRVVFVFLGSSFLLTLNGFWQFVFGVDLVRRHSIDIPGRLLRMRSSLGSPNDLAAFYLFAIPLAGWAWINQKKWSWKSAGAVCLAALFCVGFALTLSRAAFLALFLSMMAYLAARRGFRWMIIPLVAAGLFLFSSPLVRENFLGSLNTRDITIGERLSYWKTTWRMIEASPFWGNGVNTFYQNFPRFATAGETYRGYAHNCYLQMGSEVGLVGLALFLLPLFLFFWKKIPRQGALAVGVWAFLVHAFFDTHFYALQTSFLFWTFWGLLVATSEGGRSPTPNSRQ